MLGARSLGFRLAERHPEWITGLIVQNGNAYDEGLSEGAREFIALRPDKEGAEETIHDLLTLPGTRSQYETGVTDLELITPDGWTLDQHFLDLPGRKDAQVALLFDYHSNVERYDHWQAWLDHPHPAHAAAPCECPPPASACSSGPTRCSS